MAVIVQQLYEGIRAGVGAPTGVLLTDVTRILAYANEAVRQYAADAPESVKDMAVLQIGQYLYDAPVAARPFAGERAFGVRCMGDAGALPRAPAVVLGDVAAALSAGGWAAASVARRSLPSLHRGRRSIRPSAFLRRICRRGLLDPCSGTSRRTR